MAETLPVMESVVRGEHHRTLDYMESDLFRQVMAVFDAHRAETGGVYYRPVAGGVCVIDLAADSPKPRIGVGRAPIRAGATVDQVVRSMPARLAYLRAARGRQQRASLEVQLEASLVRHALVESLRLPVPFAPSLRFIHSQWRIEPSAAVGTRFTDLLAVDVDVGALAIVELKRRPDRTGLRQVTGYVDYFRQHAAELTPFFRRVARLMGQLYGAPELEEVDLVAGTVYGLVAWPVAGGLEVQHADATNP